MFVPSFIRLKEVQKGAYGHKLNQGLLFAKTAHINVSRSAAPKLALVTANRYNCGVKDIYVNALVKFH